MVLQSRRVCLLTLGDKGRWWILEKDSQEMNKKLTLKVNPWGIETIRSSRQEHRFDEALVELERPFERDPECAHLWVMRGNLIQLSEATALTLEDVFAVPKLTGEREP